jgi:hypothetical protein
MGATAALSRGHIEVQPGSTASFEVTVRNTGSVVDEFTFEPVGFNAAWFRAEPASASLLPGGEAKIVITIAPPKAPSTVAAEIDGAVKINSREDSRGSTVEEFSITIGSFRDTGAELVPVTSNGSRRGKSELAVDNRGNSRLNVSLSGHDADDALEVSFDPPGLVIEPGRANFSAVTITPRTTFWRGSDRTLPFTVMVAPEGEPAFSLPGTFVQRARLPKWLLRLLALLLVGLLALLLLWQVALKPVIRSAARAAATEQVDVAAQKAADQTVKAVTGQPPVSVASTAPPPTTDGKSDTTIGGAPVPPTVADGPGSKTGGGDDGQGGVSVDKRLAVEAAAGASASDVWVPAPKDKRFSLTDVVLQNPQGDTGRLRIKRGDDVLLETGLENFRDLDFHYVAAYPFEAEQKLIVEIDCRNPEGAQPCRAAASLVGFLR